MTIKILKTKKLGLEVWHLYLDHSLHSEFLSAEFALYAAKRLSLKLKAK